MLFNSYAYVIFLLCALVFYSLFPNRTRWLVLLVASYFFYMYWKPEYIILLLTSTTVDYLAAQKIASTDSKTSRKLWLWTSLLTNLGLLFLFKYLGFFIEILGLISEVNLPPDPSHEFELLLPIGISFYTFQTLSYTIDVYRKQYEPEKHFGKFALYVAFFPQLISGPIERAHKLLPQFNQRIRQNLPDFLLGLKQILWGFFKKILIADKIAVIVNAVYAEHYQYNGYWVLIATYLFSFQIYCDFSGYCDIAIGTARLFGYRLSANFDKPYFAGSIKDFWRRWHITLGAWFRDYLYIPLGGNRFRYSRWYFNIMVVFAVSGLWHGAGSNFVAWGILHGLFFLIGVKTLKMRAKVYDLVGINRNHATGNFIKTVITFNLVSFSWIFFRAESIRTALHIIKSIAYGVFLTPLSVFFSSFHSTLQIMNITPTESMIYFLLLVSFIVAEKINLIESRFYGTDPRKPSIPELLILDVILLLMIFLGSFGGEQFLYFQF